MEQIDVTDQIEHRGRPKGTYTEHGLQRRVDILGAIDKFGADQNYPVSASQLVRECGGSFSSIQYHLRLLREQGYVTFENGLIGRTLKRTRKDPKLTKLR